jgi:hypothetical protein
VRRNPATVVVLAGEAPDPLLATLGRSMNVSLIRPADASGAGDAGHSGDDKKDATNGRGDIELAAAALRRASGISSPYVIVAADPLAAVAAWWEAMWDVSDEQRGAAAFEMRAAEALAAWRAGRFELPDYYLVLAAAAGADAGAGRDFYLGPLRSIRPNRVAVVAAQEPAAQAAGVLHELGSLRHGPWWPPLDELIEAARRFYPGSLADAGATLALARRVGRESHHLSFGINLASDLHGRRARRRPAGHAADRRRDSDQDRRGAV